MLWFVKGVSDWILRDEGGLIRFDPAGYLVRQRRNVTYLLAVGVLRVRDEDAALDEIAEHLDLLRPLHGVVQDEDGCPSRGNMVGVVHHQPAACSSMQGGHSHPNHQRTGKGVLVEVVPLVVRLERVELWVRVQHLLHRHHVLEAVGLGDVDVVLAAQRLCHGSIE